MQPRPSHGGFPGKPCNSIPIPELHSPFSSRLLACSEYLPSDTYAYATRIHKTYRNHYRPTPHPQRLPLSCLTYTTLLITHTHKPITVHTLAPSKEEGEGEAHAPYHNYYQQHIHLYSNNKIWTVHILLLTNLSLSQTPKLHYPSSS